MAQKNAIYGESESDKGQVNRGVDGFLERLEEWVGLDGGGKRVEDAGDEGDEAARPVLGVAVSGAGGHKEWWS